MKTMFSSLSSVPRNGLKSAPRLCVTGSTIYTALGLDTLTKQKEHHYIHVRGRNPPPTPPDLQKLFDHGTKNEVNAIATLISTIVPAYLPACFAFYEVGARVHLLWKNEIFNGD